MSIRRRWTSNYPSRAPTRLSQLGSRGLTIRTQKCRKAARTLGPGLWTGHARSSLRRRLPARRTTEWRDDYRARLCLICFYLSICRRGTSCREGQRVLYADHGAMLLAGCDTVELLEQKHQERRASEPKLPTPRNLEREGGGQGRSARG